MAIEAQLFDGTIVEFPDDTDRSVIEKTVKKLTAERQLKEPEEKQSVLRQAADIPVSFAKGISQGVRMLSDAFGADNAVSANLRGVEDYLGGLLSAQAKNDQQEIAKIFKEAEDKGVLDQVQAGLKAFTVAPVDIMSQAFGTIIPTLAGGLAGQALKIGARTAAVGTGAVMGTGVGKSAIYDAVTEELKQAGLPEETIKQAATQAQEYGGKNLDLILANTLLGGVAAGTGIERALIPGMVKNISANIAKRGAIGRGVAAGAPEFITEGLQGGTEQVSQNVALQREGFDVPTFRGAGTAATMEAVAGGVMGTGIGALSRPQEAPVMRPTTEDMRAQAPATPEAPPQDQTQQTIDATTGVQGVPGMGQADVLSADEARQQSINQQIAKQNAFQSQFEQPPVASETPDQAYARQMAQQDARTPVRQYTEPPPQSPFLGVGEAAIQPGQRERAQGLAAQEFGLNVGQARPPVTEEDRIARQLAAQQEMDADRFKQQTPQPVITPAQATLPTPAPIPSARGIDRQAQLLGQRAGLPQIEQAGLSAQADIAGGTGQVAVSQTRFVDLTPMPPRAARQKLAALKADAPDADLNIVPHPQMSGRFAIEERVEPLQEEPAERREDRPSVSYEQAAQMVRDVQRTGVLTPEVSAAAQQYGLNIDPSLMQFAERTTPENLLVQQRRGMADEAALDAELRGGVATPEEAQRLRETGMGRPYDSIVAPRPDAPTELGKGERQRRLEAEAIDELNAEKTEFFKNLQGPWLQGFDVGINPKSAIQTASPQFTEQFMKPEGRYSLVTTATPEAQIAADKFLKEAMPVLKRFGLGKVGLRIVDSINGGKADGMYAQQIISLVLDSDNPMGVMRHEVIHALKELGAFTPAEWKVLSKAAKDTWINQFFDRALQDQYQQVYLEQNGNLDGFQEYLQEEAIAQAFRFFTETKPPSGMIANLMRRLNAFFEALGNFFRGQGFQNIDEMFLPNRILADIERGAIQPGRAQGRTEELPAYSLKSLNPVMRGVAEEVGLTAQEILATSLPLQTGLAGDAAFEKKKLKGIPEVVKFLEDRRRMTGVPLPELDVSKEEDRNTLAKLITAEAMAAIRAGGNAIDWYDGVINRTMAVAGVKYPELNTNDNSRTAFKLAMAITSQGMNVEDNIKFASNVYEQYRKNNKFPEIGTGGSAKVMKNSFKLANDMISTMGMDTFKDFLQKPFTVKQINDLGFKVSGELKSEKVLGSIIFGSKIGFGFYSNLSGNFDPVTMDMWFMRTIGRLTGTLKDFDPTRFNKQVQQLRNSLDERGTNGIFADSFDTDLVELAKTDDEAAVELARKVASAHEKDFKNNRALFDSKKRKKSALVLSADPIIKSMDKPIDAPGSGGVKSNMRKVFAKVRENVKNIYGSDIPSAALQALIWYPEQSLYKQLGVKLRVTNQDYAGAMQKLLLSEGYNEQRIIAAAKSAAGRGKQVSGAVNAQAEQAVSAERGGVDEQPRFSLRTFEPNQSALRPSPSSNAGISFNPVKEDAVSLQGSHYGKARTEVLNGAKYGQGLRGAEARRLEQSDDDRIKRRVYFYIPRANDTMPNRESGVGGYVYTQKLDNILAPGPTMGRLNKEAGGDANKFESLIVDNGYDGYAVPDYGMMVILNQDVPVNYEGTVDEVHGNKKFSLRAPTTPEFKRFFKDSKVVDSDGNPLVVYHGTNQEINEFTTQPSALRSKFYAGEIGSWFGDDPKIANNFAKGVSSPRQGGSVYPVFLNIKNPKVYESYEDFLSDAKGRRSAPAMRKDLIKQGFDGIQIKDSDTDFGGRRDDFVAFYPQQIKSAFNQRPTESPDIRYSLRAPKTPEFKRFFGNSKITNPDGTPKMMYHGTARIIDEFIPKQAGAIFVTDNPEFAEIFTNESLQYMVREQINAIETMFKDMSPKDQLALMKNGYKLAVKEQFLSKTAVKEEIAELTDMVNQGLPLTNEFYRVAESFAPSIEKSLESGRNIMPLYVRAENPFDYENPEHIAQLQQNPDRLDVEEDIPRIQNGNWNVIEASDIQELIKDLGFDGFYVKEGGEKNLAVYNPNQIKSAIGNRGTYDETGRILYSLKNAPPNRYTKLAPDDPSAGKAIIKAAESAFNAVKNDGTRTSARINLIDRFSGLSRTLESLPLFNDGTLRADMLHHAKAQGINLIKGGLLSGTPYVTDDGTIGINRSENNLARAAYLADRLNTNQNVVESGLSGRAMVAEVARILRGADILAEDAELRQLGDRQILEAKKMSDELKKLVQQGVSSPKSVAAAQKAIDNMRRIGSANRKMNRELQVKPEDIAWARKQLDLIPEVQEVLDIWKAVNTSLVNLWEDTGLLDKETADKYRAAKNYVPLFKSREDLNEESFFRTGSGTKATAKIKKLEGADISRNIWENVDKQYAIMIAAAYENQTRRVSVEQMRGISPDLAEITNQSDPRVNLRYRDNGKDVHVVIENPNDLAAFQSMSYQLSPIMKFLGGFTNVLRAGALLNPMFWIRQLIRDPIHATIAGQSGVVTPVHSAAEFLRIITQNSEEARILASRGVIGQFDSTVTLNEFLGNVGKDKQQAPGVLQKSLHKLMQIHEASDAATRVAIFKKAKAKALKDNMSEAQAVDYAVFKARESINFALTGNSPTLANARQMIPFLNATIVGLDTLYRAATGYGLNPEEKAKARSMFRNRAMMLTAMSLAYAVSMQDDEDYKKQPDYVKDGNWLIPMSTETGKTFVKVSVPYEVGFLFKTLPEIFVRYLSGTSTGKESLSALRAGFIHNMPTGGVPIPQFAKPALEVVTNHSFFTNRPIEGMGDSRLPVSHRGQKASEFAKMMSGLGLDEIGMSPAKIDVLTKGYFAEFGAFFNELTDALLSVGSGKEKTPRNIENQPFMKAFLTDPQVNKAISDFYDIESNATQVANLFSKYKNEGQGDMLRAMVDDAEKIKQVGGAPVMRQISSAMSDIQKAIRIIDKNQGMQPEERRERINELQKQLGMLAERGKQVANSIGLSR